MKQLLRDLAKLELTPQFHPDQQKFIAYIYTFYSDKIPVIQFNGEYEDVVKNTQEWVDKWMVIKNTCDVNLISFSIDNDGVFIYDSNSDKELIIRDLTLDFDEVKAMVGKFIKEVSAWKA